MNEKITENLVRDILRKHWYSDIGKIDEQISQNPIIQELLQDASKSKKWKWRGRPEFIITFPHKDRIIVVECKADITKHDSGWERKKTSEYAVDWALHYGKKLSKEYNVIAIAVSGIDKKELKISNFLFPKWITKEIDLVLWEILKSDEYETKISNIKNGDQKKKDHSELIKFSKDLHNDIRDYGKLSVSQKPLFVSWVLIALHSDSFASSYEKEANLQKLLYQAICNKIDGYEIQETKKKLLKHSYSFLENHPNLSKPYKDSSMTVLSYLIKQIQKNMMPFFNSNNEYDIIGSFYWEFLRYTWGDKQWLWIVLTPKHITELFVELARVNVNSIVYDPCCGTWWFLISAMAEMIKQANWNKDIEERIKKKQLIWIEQEPNMYTLACSNMILRWDGKANIYQWDCFDPELTEKIKWHKPNIGFVNPPYSQKGEWQSEMAFIEHMLDCLEKNWTGIAIVPISCALTSNNINNETKKRILGKHTLEAVFSMPWELFYPVWVVTCVMIFTAHLPHNNLKESFFWYYKDDGFEKTKNDGRIDKKHKYEDIKQKRLKLFFNRKEEIWYSALKCVSWNDEWCAEAYMETDYSSLNEQDFISEIKKFILFKELNS